MKNNRFVLLLMTMLIMVTMLSGCSNEQIDDNAKEKENTSEKDQGNDSPNESIEYKVSVKDGVYTVMINDPKEQLSQPGYTIFPLVFDSFAEMVDSFKNNNFSRSQLAALKSSFPMNSNGEYVVGNLDDLYSPVLPQNIGIDWVTLYSGGYYVGFDWGTNNYGVVDIITDEEKYEKRFAEGYSSFVNSEVFIITETYRIDDRDSEVIEYTNGVGVFRRIRYTITLPQGTMLVDEEYRARSSGESVETFESSPEKVSIYVEDGDVWYIVDMRSYEDFMPLSERPTVEWLSSIKLEKYVHSDNLVTE